MLFRFQMVVIIHDQDVMYSVPCRVLFVTRFTISCFSSHLARYIHHVISHAHIVHVNRVVSFIDLKSVKDYSVIFLESKTLHFESFRNTLFKKFLYFLSSGTLSISCWLHRYSDATCPQRGCWKML